MMRIHPALLVIGGLVVLAAVGCESTELTSRSDVAVTRDVPESRPARQLGGGAGIADRLSCSTLCQRKQTTETAFREIADMGFRYVDLSCLTWAPHASVVNMRKDFEAEALRVERLLAAHRLGVSNLTFDAIETMPWEQYEQDFRNLVRLADRLHAKVINIMAPSKKVDLQDQIGKLRKLQAIAAEQQVRLTVETHVGQVTELPADAAKLCEQVTGLGLTLDPSHYYAGPNQGKPFDELYPKVFGTGFRAGGLAWEQIQLPWGEGPIDFAKIVRDLEAAGYKGFYVAEYLEGLGQVDPLIECRKFLEWGRGL
ncbi:MAG TPA: sugar phosphate isomerase/epimerase [Phycisphaerae bacterium]|nr:sugar phosphate isomerase/epimerase [Phycisphaerae bacterium]